jgi:anaphase-promoting complex subunit 6
VRAVKSYPCYFLIPCIGDPNDAFWLAQTYFLSHQYSRAEYLLTQPFRADKSASFPPRSDENQPGSIPSLKGKARQVEDDDTRLVDMSVTCRYLAAQCQVCTDADLLAVD